MICTVGTNPALSAALNLAKAGDTIQLAAGVYSPVSIWAKNYAQDVVITSVDVANPAVLKGLSIGSSSGLTFTGLTFDAAGASTGNPFLVSDSRDIHFSELGVHGSLDRNPQNDVTGLYIRRSTDVSVTDSEFQQLQAGITHSAATGLTIANNRFHDIRVDGIAGGGSSNVVISGNSFRDFYPVAGDHPDAIQFWTTNSTASAHDIRIVNNEFVRGAGAAVQGIFIRDEVGSLPYERLTISGNLVAGGVYHGIAVLGGRSVTITDNIVQGFTDMKSWILTQNVSGGTIQDNAANEYVNWGGTTGVAMARNGVLPLAADSGATARATWSAVTSADNQRIAGGAAADTLIGGSGADTLTDAGGANILRGDDGADHITGGANVDDAGGGLGADTVNGGLGDDSVAGGDGADSLLGADGADFVYGGLGADTVDGGAGNDVLRGGQGDDRLFGQAGNDWLSGDRGADTLTGGLGADVFVSFGAAGVDRIVDFKASEGDRVQLAAGSSYGLAQVGADTVVSISGGAQVILQGVQLGALPAGWIFVG